jgi:phosphoribosylanthranilate isomerase
MNRVQIKICGVTNLKDAVICADLGVEMIGLNFCHQSPRYIEPIRAHGIVGSLRDKICFVGVFADATAHEVREIASLVDLTCVQLHGNVSAETGADLTRDFRVIRAFQTNGNFNPEDATAFAGCDLLLDAHHPVLAGGTGQTCDWTAARRARPFARFLILSGGLNTNNVVEAIATVAPDAVDVCSGVEIAPGIKSRDALEDFVAGVRST